MRMENFLSFSIIDLVNILVTVLSVIFIVKQLAEARLATQMSGFLTLSSQFVQIAFAIEFIDLLIVSKEWKSFSDEEAFQYINDDDTRREMFKQVAIFYEILGALLRRGALDRKLGMDTFGGIGARRWQEMEKVAREYRRVLGQDKLYEQWEWFANNFHD